MNNEQIRRTHILVECPELIASVRVGVLDALGPLDKEMTETRFCKTRAITKSDIQWADIFVCVRGCEELSFALAREAKRLGRLLVYFLDDDLLNLPEDTMAYRYFRDNNNQKYLLKILEKCDVLWGVNPLIRDNYYPYCKNSRWICTRVPAVLSDLPKKSSIEHNDESINILYAGSRDHQTIIRELIAPAVKMVLRAFPRGVSFTFVGADPGIHGDDRVKFHPFFYDYAEYRRFMQCHRFSVGLAPVRTTNFYQCKYYNKFVEYTSIGAAGIYTDCPLYRQIIISGQNGVLCNNTAESWAEAITSLIDNPEQISMYYSAAEQIIQNNFSPGGVAKQLKRQLPELVDFRAPDAKDANVFIPNPMIAFYRDRICYLFRRYGIGAIPIIGWKIIKKTVTWIARRCEHTV